MSENKMSQLGYEFWPESIARSCFDFKTINWGTKQKLLQTNKFLSIKQHFKSIHSYTHVGRKEFFDITKTRNLDYTLGHVTIPADVVMRSTSSRKLVWNCDGGHMPEGDRWSKKRKKTNKLWSTLFHEKQKIANEIPKSLLFRLCASCCLVCELASDHQTKVSIGRKVCSKMNGLGMGDF